MEPEKLKELITTFCKEIYGAFEACPKVIVLPAGAFDVLMKLCPEVFFSEGSAITLNMDWGICVVRKG